MKFFKYILPETVIILLSIWVGSFLYALTAGTWLAGPALLTAVLVGTAGGTSLCIKAGRFSEAWF